MRKILLILVALLTMITFFSACDNHTHTPGEWITDKAPSCTMDGQKHQICSTCGETIKAEIISATGHEPSNWIIDQEPTCTVAGSKHQICATCGETIKTETIPQTGHTPGEWVIDQEPTCTVAGSKHQICATCGETIKTESIALQEHRFGDWIAGVSPTCAQPGVKAHKECVVCKKSFDESNHEIADLSIPKTEEHEFNSEIIVNATASHSGTKKYTCKICGKTYQESFELERLSSEEIYALGEKSTVEITTYDKKGDGIALGTGFVVDPSGKIITNFHVIDNAYSIKVRLGKTTYSVTSVLAYSEDIDLAILQIYAPELPALELCFDAQPGGASVYALGSSEGYTLSFSSGIIASPERIFDGVKYIQHNAAISHGNSGGPLFNAFGQVIGINTSTNPNGQNLNFAISSSEINNLPTDGPFTMAEFYEMEGPYFEINIGDYLIYERETNDTYAEAQSITINGTTVSGKVSGASDCDFYRITLLPGETLNIIMIPDYAIDCNGIICGLSDSSYNALAIGSKITLDDGSVCNILTYTNYTTVSLNLYYLMVFSSSYVYKNTTAPYKIFFYKK